MFLALDVQYIYALMLWATTTEEGDANRCPLMVLRMEWPDEPVALFPKLLLEEVNFK